MTEAEKHQWKAAEKRVKYLKGFYEHLFAFIIIVPTIFILRYYILPKTGWIPDNENVKTWLQWNILLMPGLWLIALIIHGLSVFSIKPLKDWEQKKIKEIMDVEDKNNQQKWN